MNVGRLRQQFGAQELAVNFGAALDQYGGQPALRQIAQDLW